jgi:gluconokinase
MVAPMLLVVAGVSGCGKTSVGQALAAHLGAQFFDGDDFHPEANVAKMRAGQSLNDEDRAPWLVRLNELMREQASQGHSAVLACSALKVKYREILGRGLPDLRFVHLKGGREILFERMQARKHRYMPASLLDSQFATLEAFDASAYEIDVAVPLDQVVAKAVKLITLNA